MPETRQPHPAAVGLWSFAAAAVLATSTAFAQNAPIIGVIANAASYQRGSISPGEMVVVFGSFLGPSQLTHLQLNASGKLSTSLAGVQVSFSGIPAPLIYVSSTQLCAMVPYEVAGTPSTQVTVNYEGLASQPSTASVAAAAPGIYSANASGQGPAAASNADGSVNSATNPAALGSYVTFYLTGEGQLAVPGSDGAIATTADSVGSLVTVTIGGVPAQVMYAGAAPGNTDGFAQVDAIIPATLHTGGQLPLVVQVGNVVSQSGLTIAVNGPLPSVQPKRTVVLIHGLGQGSSNMNQLNLDLSDPTYGIDLSRFTVDSAFNWSTCAALNIAWPSYCSIEEGATELATHIAGLPNQHVILVGYSLGGLLARDLILNNRNQILATHPVDALITLGTPNVGYPGENLDSLVFCPKLVTEMSSDWRSEQSQNKVIESAYLSQLNTAWTTSTIPTPNLHWLAVSGAFCSNPVRNSVSNTGCRDANPYSDGVVCNDSAVFNLTGNNLPTARWSNTGYAHTNDTHLLGATLFAGCNAFDYPPLDGSTSNSSSPLIQELKSFIDAQ